MKINNKFYSDRCDLASKILQKIIKKNGIRHDDLAKACLCPVSTIVKILKGAMVITPKMAQRIKTYVGIKDDLIDRLNLYCIFCNKKLKKAQVFFCSNLCAKRHKGKSRYFIISKTKCVFCSKRIKNTGKYGPRRRFCSDQCKYNCYYRKIGSVYKYQEMKNKITCCICGKKFKRNSINQKTCSKLCWTVRDRELDSIKYATGTINVTIDVKKYLAAVRLGRILLYRKITAQRAAQIKKSIEKGKTHEAYR